MIKLHVHRVGALAYGLGADEPTCTPGPGDATGFKAIYIYIVSCTLILKPYDVA
jgi:hypothetical protein